MQLTSDTVFDLTFDFSQLGLVLEQKIKLAYYLNVVEGISQNKIAKLLNVKTRVIKEWVDYLKGEMSAYREPFSEMSMYEELTRILIIQQIIEP